MSNLVPSLLAVIARRSKARFLRKANQADLVQEQFLRSLLQAHKDTELGRQYGLANIYTIDQFREQVPILPYSAYEPYIERTANGETNLLTAEPVVFFNMSSGSTGNRKLIPVTKRSRRMVARANQTALGFVADAAKRDRLPIGTMLFTSPSKSLGYTNSGIPYGPISTSDLRLMGAIYRQVFAYPFAALQVADIAARHYLCLLFALRNSSLGVIGATFPVLALRLADYLEQYAQELIEDLETGTIAPWLKLAPELRLQLERQWQAYPTRAAELRQILQTEGRLTPKSAFPNLSFIVTARGGTSNFYLERFPDYFGNVPVFGGTYASSETVFGVHRDFNTDGVILAIESGFYEFLPEDQWQAEHPQTLLPWQVKPGDRYRILVTNYSGFYRYDIGDVVEVEGFCGKAPIFIFRHRLGGVISSTTEKTSEFHIMQTMQQLKQEFNVSLENFCVTLSNDQIPPCYLLNIELAEGQVLPDPKQFLQRFDQILQNVHESYAVKRPDQVPSPRLRILESGSFALVQQRLVQRGANETQLKFPHVSDDRNLLAGLKVEQEV
ncbi:MAG: GH3 auxin-responsive promoter family protein [Elainellaceae cyanobacterium]